MDCAFKDSTDVKRGELMLHSQVLPNNLMVTIFLHGLTIYSRQNILIQHWSI